MTPSTHDGPGSHLPGPFADLSAESLEARPHLSSSSSSGLSTTKVSVVDKPDDEDDDK